MLRKSVFILFSIILLFRLPAFGDDLDPRYAAGTVPEVDGKVVFTRTLTTNMANDKLFAKMNEWLKLMYKDKDNTKNRIVLSNTETGELAALGEQELNFRSGSLFTDRAYMLYQLLIEIEDGSCKLTFRNVKYRYDEAGKEKIFTAEELITDEVALNKDKTKLNRYYDKFRKHTIDFVNNYFDSAAGYLGIPTSGTAQATETPVALPTATMPVVAPTPSTPPVVVGTESADMPGFRRVDADKIPGNIVKLLGDWTLITSGTERVNTMTASWGGLGVLWEQPVSFCFINPTRYSINTMDEGDVYTISFYTEAYKDALRYCGSHSGRNEDKIKNSGLTPLKTPSGATAFSEAWMIIECKKIVAQPISSDAVTDKDGASRWSKDGYHKMYIGKILNVWIK